jgi:hypothetical protein
MHSAISATGGDYPETFSGQPEQGFFNLILHSGRICLKLKTAVVAAIIFKYQDNFGEIASQLFHRSPDQPELFKLSYFTNSI